MFLIINGNIQFRVCLKECAQVWWSGCGLYVSHGLREQVYTSESVSMSGNECICVCVSVSELWCAPHQVSLQVWTLTLAPFDHLISSWCQTSPHFSRLPQTSIYIYTQSHYVTFTVCVPDTVLSAIGCSSKKDKCHQSVIQARLVRSHMAPDGDPVALGTVCGCAGGHQCQRSKGLTHGYVCSSQKRLKRRCFTQPMKCLKAIGSVSLHVPPPPCSLVIS